MMAESQQSPMSTRAECDIELLEERLRLAMLSSDVACLDALIAPNLVFTNHFGGVLSKQEDLDLHRSGALKIKAMQPSERKIMVLDPAAFVTVRVQLSGVWNGSPFNDDIRFSRVWHRSPTQGWQVIAGQATVVQA